MLHASTASNTSPKTAGKKLITNTPFIVLRQEMCRVPSLNTTLPARVMKSILCITMSMYAVTTVPSLNSINQIRAYRENTTYDFENKKKLYPYLFFFPKLR